MEKDMLVKLLIIKRKEKEFIIIIVVVDMKVIGRIIKREMICSMFEQVELKILIRIINNNKKEKIKLNDINKTDDNNIKNKNPLRTPLNGNFSKSLTIQDKIRIFNGEFIKRKIYRNENTPGKLKIPEIFLQQNKDKEN